MPLRPVSPTRSHGSAIAGSLLGLLLLLPGCLRPGEADLPGEPVGQYRVRAALVNTACGAGHPSPAELNFFVELRHLRGSTTGYWKLPESPIVDGTFDGTRFRFESTQQVVGVPADQAAGVVGCVLERTEVVSGELTAPGLDGDGGATADAGTNDGGAGGDASVSDAGVPDASSTDAGTGSDGGSAEADAGAMPLDLTGTTTVEISVVPGSDCSPLLLPQGGAFPALPCTLEYELTAEQLDEPLF